MNKKEFLVIGSVILILAIIVFVIVNMNKEQSNTPGGQDISQGTPAGNEGEQQEVKEFVEVQADGSQVNTSSKLKETKTFDELEITGITLVEKDNLSQILADVKNNTSSTKGDYPATMVILDKEGNTIIELGIYIEQVEPGETVQLNTAVTADISNAYDFTIKK